jgi:hypothetical protein
MEKNLYIAVLMAAWITRLDTAKVPSPGLAARRVAKDGAFCLLARGYGDEGISYGRMKARRRGWFATGKDAVTRRLPPGKMCGISRTTALICLLLSLLCPVLCFAEAAGEWSVSDHPCGNVCEAMAVGAVVDGPDRGPVSPHDLPSPLDGLMPLDLPAFGLHSPLPPVARLRPARWPLTAMRRHALLQAFLF